MSVPITFARLTGLDHDLVRQARALYIRSALRLPAPLDLARRRLGAGRRLGRRRPAPRHDLAAALVPDLGPAPRGPLPRPPPAVLVLAITAFQLGTRIPL